MSERRRWLKEQASLAAERDALAARVEELEARIAEADKALPEYRPYCTCEFCEQTVEVRRILRGEDDTP